MTVCGWIGRSAVAYSLFGGSWIFNGGLGPGKPKAQMLEDIPDDRWVFNTADELNIMIDKKNPSNSRRGLCIKIPAAPTLPHSRPCSTIGAGELNFASNILRPQQIGTELSHYVLNPAHVPL